MVKNLVFVLRSIRVEIFMLIFLCIRVLIVGVLF